MLSLMAARWICVLPAIECYWLVNASPLNYGRWVGQNSGPIFSRLWTKVHQIKFACAGVSVVCNAVFRLAMSCCVPEVFAIKSRSFRNRAEILMFWGRQISGKGPPEFMTEFYKSGPPSNMWQSLVRVTIGQATWEIRCWKRSKHQQQNIMACLYYRRGSHKMWL